MSVRKCLYVCKVLTYLVRVWGLFPKYDMSVYIGNLHLALSVSVCIPAATVARGVMEIYRV